MSILGFSKIELKAVVAIFLVTLILMAFNFRISLRKQRDAQRKQDVRDILNDISKYQVDYGYIPTPAQYQYRLLHDPTNARQYLYQNVNGKISVYASLEGKNEAEYDSKIEAMHLLCGSVYCNFGLSFTDINKK